MMGPKKLSTIKDELSAALQKEGLDEAWLVRQLRKLDRRAGPSRERRKTISTLRALAAKSGGRSRRRKTRAGS